MNCSTKYVQKLLASKAKTKRQRDNWKAKANMYQLALLRIMGSAFATGAIVELCRAAIKEETT